MTEVVVKDEAYLSSIEEIIEDARQGKIFILVDDENRENEGDLVIPASMASSTPYCTSGLFTTGSISFGMLLVAGKNRVP